MEQQHKILFTGLTGNLGRTLIPLLKKNNYIVYTTYKYQKELDFIGEKDSEFINPIKCDLLSEKDIAKMVTSFKIHFDSVVNLVGGFIYKDLISSDINDIKKMMDINLYSVFNICKYSPKILASSSNKSIINMLTPYAENPVAGVCAYSSSKAALLNLSKSMAIEFEKYSIRVNSIMTDNANIFLLLFLSILYTHFAVPPVANKSSIITKFLKGFIEDSCIDKESFPYSKP